MLYLTVIIGEEAIPGYWDRRCTKLQPSGLTKKVYFLLLKQASPKEFLVTDPHLCCLLDLVGEAYASNNKNRNRTLNYKNVLTKIISLNISPYWNFV